jgi:hypothetical protein
MHFDTLSPGHPPEGRAQIQQYNAAISSRFPLFRKLLGVLLTLAGQMKCSAGAPVEAAAFVHAVGRDANSHWRASRDDFVWSARSLCDPYQWRVTGGRDNCHRFAGIVMRT